MLNADSVNKVMLMGKVFKEPQWNTTNNARTLNFTVITIEKIKRNGTFQVHQEYHNISIAERLVDAANITTGCAVYIQGRLQTRQFVDGKGIKHYRAEVVACSAELVD